MYKPSLLFDRTDEERRDPFISWKRQDQPFFASGACHILAEMFRQLHSGEGYETVYIKPGADRPGTHVYMSDGIWTFDHNGWTKEKELLSTIEVAYEKRYPGWRFGRIVISDDLETFCIKNNHRLPWQFAFLPWERAYNYIRRFPDSPPV